MPVTVEMLRGNSLFNGLKEEEMERLTRLIFIRGYKAGRTLFFENTPGEVMYLVHNGMVGIFKSTGDKNKLSWPLWARVSFSGRCRCWTTSRGRPRP